MNIHELEKSLYRFPDLILSAVLFIHHLITESPIPRRKHSVKKARAFLQFRVSCISFRNKWSLVSYGGVLKHASQGLASINQEENCRVMHSKAICRMGALMIKEASDGGDLKIFG